MVDFGNTLKTLRLRKNMTQAQLAQKLGLTKSVISLNFLIFSHSKRFLPTKQQIIQVLQGFS